MCVIIINYEQMAGFSVVTDKIIYWCRFKPLHLYFGLGAFFQLSRWYSTQKAFNYHFGRIEFQRRLERNQI